MALASTNLSPEEQVRSMLTYNDQVAAGSGMEGSAATLNDDINSVISQLNRIINSTVGGNDWFADINTTTSGKQRGVNDLNTDLADLEERKVVCRTPVLADITIAASENWVILGSGELPSEVAAIATTENGTVGANSALSGGAFDVHELIEIAGANATAPNNLARVRDATTLQTLQSGGRDIYALMQFESGLSDGDTILTTTPDRAKLSFVIVNGAGDDLIACPVGDIENETINYSYVTRVDLESVPETCFLADSTFTNRTSGGGGGVSNLQEAYEGGNTIVTDTTNGDLDVSGTEAISLDASGASNFTVAGAALTLSTTTSGLLTLSGAGGVTTSVSGGNYLVDATSAVTNDINLFAGGNANMLGGDNSEGDAAPNADGIGQSTQALITGPATVKGQGQGNFGGSLGITERSLIAVLVG